jgi:hypothetical protein
MTSQVPADLSGVREELDLILRSRAFRDRETLQNLLDYLVRRTLDGTADALKEYVIGVDVFGKPDGYDPQTDPSVRVQIGRLRRKLEEYYLAEGASDPLVLQLPKRHFAISFEPRVVTNAPAGEPVPGDIESPPEPVLDQSPRSIPWVRVAHAAITLLLAGLVMLLLTRGTTTRTPSTSDAEAEIWKPFLEGSRPVVMSLGTLLFYQYPGGMVRDPELDRLTAPQRQPRLDELQRMLHAPEPLKPDLIYTGVGQATAAFLLAKEFDRLKVPLDLVRSTVLSWDEIAKHNVIFVGSAKLNSQLREIPVTWAFRVEGSRILNLHPKPTEESSYGPDSSLISLFPGLHGQGEILVVESGSTTGVWAAAQFLTDPGYAREMVAHLRQPNGRIPRHYQVVLKSQIAADVPIQIRYVTHRTL